MKLGRDRAYQEEGLRMKKISIVLQQRDVEYLERLASECHSTPERWAAETVECAIAEKRGFSPRKSLTKEEMSV